MVDHMAMLSHHCEMCPLWMGRVYEWRFRRCVYGSRVMIQAETEAAAPEPKQHIFFSSIGNHTQDIK